MTKARLLNTYMELKIYFPSLKPPVKNGDIVYSQIYIGNTTPFNDWKSNFMEWTKDNGHGLFVKVV